MRIDESVAYYWTSLALSAAGVIVFLWLLAPPRPKKDATGKSASEIEAERKSGDQADS